MSKFARLLAVLGALYMALALVWSGARFPFMGVDQELFGQGPRPSALVDKPWPAELMKQWSRQFNVDVLVAGTPLRPGVIAGYAAPTQSEFSSWLNDGYPCFNVCSTRPVDLSTHPDELNYFEVDVAGLYFMGDRSADAAAAAQTYFASIGWDTGHQEMDSRATWMASFQQLFQRLATLFAVLVPLLTAGTVLTRSRASGVFIFLGTSRWEFMLTDVVSWTRMMATGSALAAAGVSVWSFVAYHGHQLERILLALGPLCLAFYLVGALGIVAAHQVLRLTSIIDLIKGRARFGPALPVIYLVRSIVIISATTLLVALGISLSTYNTQRSLETDLGPFDDYSVIGFNSGSGDNASRRAQAADEITKLFSDGKVVLTQARPAFYYDTSETLGDQLRSGQEKLVVEASAGYLRVEPARLPNGRAVDPARDLDPSRMNLLVPTGTDPSLVDTLRTYVRTLLASEDFGSIPGMTDDTEPNIVTLASSDNSRTTYADGIARVAVPIMIIYPDTFRAGPDFAPSQSGLFVRTAEARSVLGAAPGLASLASTPQETRDIVRQATDAAATDINRGLMELLGMLLVLPLSTMAVAFLYARQHAQRIFVQTANGHSLVSIAPLLVAMDTITVAATCWYAWPQTATLSDLHSYGDDAVAAPTTKFALAVIVLAAVLCVQYAALKRLQWVIVRRSAGEE